MTMTAKRLAELDAVMAKATLGHWHVFQCVQLEGDTLFQLEARVEPDTLQCVSTDIAGEDDAAAIVALHNAYPDLRAHIDAQAATIARLTEQRNIAYGLLWPLPTNKQTVTGAAIQLARAKLLNGMSKDEQAAAISAARVSTASATVCPLCDGTGHKDHASFAMDACNHEGAA